LARRWMAASGSEDIKSLTRLTSYPFQSLDGHRAAGTAPWPA
jgi:hypothetical protein